MISSFIYKILISAQALSFQAENSLGGAIYSYLIQNDMFTFKVDVFIPLPALLIFQ